MDLFTEHPTARTERRRAAPRLAARSDGPPEDPQPGETEPVDGSSQTSSAQATTACPHARPGACSENALRSTLVLAAHTKVVAALSGERDVTTGYVAEPRAADPCRPGSRPCTASWRTLVRCDRGAPSRPFAAPRLPRPRPGSELGRPGRRTRPGWTPRAAGPLRPRPSRARGSQCRGATRRAHPPARATSGTRWTLEAAARIAGYHLTALALMAADPTTPHTASLPRTDELRDPGRGPGRAPPRAPRSPPPDLLAQRAPGPPRPGGRGARVSRELDLCRARQPGQPDRPDPAQHGLQPEEVVAVVTDRTLDWMASVLAFSGRLYLPPRRAALPG